MNRFLLSVALTTVASTAFAQPTDVRWTLDLSGRNWQREGIRPGQGEMEGFHGHFGSVAGSTFNWNGAQVPGDVYTDLWRRAKLTIRITDATG